MEHDVKSGEGGAQGPGGAQRGRRLVLKLQELGVDAAGGLSCQPTSHCRKSQVSPKHQPSASRPPPTTAMTFLCEESLCCHEPETAGPAREGGVAACDWKW